MLSTAGICDWFRSPELLVSWETNMSIVKRILPLIAATFTLFAQTDRGSIEGTVKDPNGAVVPGAKVQVVNIETNSKLDFSTSELGNYLAANLPVGSYRLVVQKEGFRTVVREPILVRRRATWQWTLHFSSARLPTPSPSAMNRRYWTCRPPRIQAISPPSSSTTCR